MKKNTLQINLNRLLISAMFHVLSLNSFAVDFQVKSTEFTGFHLAITDFLDSAHIESCSGAVFSRIINGIEVRTFNTAKHCILSKNYISDDTKLISETVSLLNKPGSNYSNLPELLTLANQMVIKTRDDFVYRNLRFGDTAYVSLADNEMVNSPTLRVGSSLPNFNEHLKIEGFPRGKYILLENCMYLGTTLIMPINDDDDFSIGHKVKCPTKLKGEEFQSISGAAIVNSKNEVVGTITRSLNTEEGVLFFEDQTKSFNANEIYTYEDGSKTLNTKPGNLHYEFELDEDVLIKRISVSKDKTSEPYLRLKFENGKLIEMRYKNKLIDKNKIGDFFVN